MRESDLYEPVKQFLETRGYAVKGEVRGCDLVAVKEDAPTLIVELKLSFSLDLVLQGVNRLTLTDDVYLAVPAPDSAGKKKAWRSKSRDIVKLCKRLGFGLMQVTADRVDVLVDPVPYQPRKNVRAHTRLIREFSRRQGDPNTGGVTRQRIVTAYRQAALRCAQSLEGAEEGKKVAVIRQETGAENAGSILAKNHYGWFARISMGVYVLTEAGQEALVDYRHLIKDSSSSA